MTTTGIGLEKDKQLSAEHLEERQKLNISQKVLLALDDRRRISSINQKQQNMHHCKPPGNIFSSKHKQVFFLSLLSVITLCGVVLFMALALFYGYC